VFGKNIDLGKTAPTGLENTGWAYRLNEGLASVGPSGLLSVPARDNVGEMHILSAEIAPQAPGMGVGTDVELNLDGRCVARQYLVDAGGNTIAAVLPPDSTRRAAALAVEFHVRTEAAGTPPGIVLRRLALLPVTTRDSARPYDPGEEIAFGLMGNAYEYTLCGWAMPQVQGAWTVGGEASLALSLQPNSHIAFELQVRAKPFLSHLAPVQEVEVFVNDEAIATWSYDREEVTVNTARVPAALLGKYPCAYLRLRFNNPVSLKEIGLGTDDLARCLFVESIRLVPAD